MTSNTCYLATHKHQRHLPPERYISQDINALFLASSAEVLQSSAGAMVWLLIRHYIHNKPTPNLQSLLTRASIPLPHSYLPCKIILKTSSHLHPHLNSLLLTIHKSHITIPTKNITASLNSIHVHNLILVIFFMHIP